MPVSVKICGLTTQGAVRDAVEAGADYVGFVFYPSSPRHITVEQAASLSAHVPAPVSFVSVLVNPTDSLLGEINAILSPSCIQLHGHESVEHVARIKKTYPRIQIIKAFSVRTGDDIAQAMRYADVIDMFLFDAKPPNLPGMLPGGNGLSFDWALLKGREFPKPWMLSGGLTPDNVADAIAQSGATMVDVSSGVESAPGVKDAGLINAFIEAAKA